MKKYEDILSINIDEKFLKGAKTPVTSKEHQMKKSDFVEELDGLPPTSFYPMGDNTSKSYDPDQEITPKKTKKESSGKKRTCHHKIFGDGVIEEELDPLTVRVKFPQFGVKVIRKEYLDL